ncbi:hypothetical protein [Streptomyces flaveolus]
MSTPSTASPRAEGSGESLFVDNLLCCLVVMLTPPVDGSYTAQ